MWGGSRKRRGRTHCKKMRGGAFYEFKGALGDTGAGAEWSGVDNLAATPAGQILPNNGSELLAAPLAGGRRRRGRTGKKGTRKGKKSRRVTRRRRTMRGGAPWESISGTRAEWMGDGSAGLPTFVAGNSNIGTSGHVQNPDGGYHV